MQTSFGARTPMWPPKHGPQVLEGNVAPESRKPPTRPSFHAFRVDFERPCVRRVRIRVDRARFHAEIPQVGPRRVVRGNHPRLRTHLRRHVRENEALVHREPTTPVTMELYWLVLRARSPLPR